MKQLSSANKDYLSIFPMSNESGGDTTHINTALLQQLSKGKQSLSPEKLQEITKDHLVFLMSGGAGGKWKTILIKGLILGIYTGPESKDGRQASFEKTRLDADLEFSFLELPFSNFCGAYAPQVSFKNADLSHCLFTDAMLCQVDFTKTNLCNSDFSRADLSGGSFIEADCSGADFENCNLVGANFTNARLSGARFPGANLKDVIY